jgi:chromosomal replication initiator protein
MLKTEGEAVLPATAITNSQEWKNCQAYMSRRMTEQSFNTWLRPIRGEVVNHSDFKVAVPNQFVADWVQGHFSELIEEAFVEVLGKRYEIIYVITGQNEFEEQIAFDLFNGGDEPTSAPRQRSTLTNNNLNPKYTFDTLVVANFNEFAFAASMAVAEGPGMTKYNPLFIYGGTGLGKTHIVQAIGNSIFQTFPEKRIIYATSEKFTSDFIASISDRTISDFTRVYRDVDVLIIDDIQFFTGKESTQEQFFHTFNNLYHFGKQIILTSDRSPKEIKGLEERLLSRFSWGLVTDLQAPDLEARTAILHKKLESEGMQLPANVIRFIADKVSSNIRELEGALIRILAYASLKKTPVDLETAQKVLSDSLLTRKRDLSIESIQLKTSEYFNIPPEMMKAKKKTAEIALARQVSMYLARSLTRTSLQAIGDAFGGRDHSTVIHACDLISKRMATDPALRDKIDKISAALLY